MTQKDLLDFLSGDLKKKKLHLKFDWRLTFSNDRVRLGYEIKRRIDEFSMLRHFRFCSAQSIYT